MQAREKILDDVARFAGGAVGALSGLRRQIKDEVRSRLDELAHKLDLVPREDFERLELVLLRAREEQTEMAKRIEALEARLGGSAPAKKKPSRKTSHKGKKKS